MRSRLVAIARVIHTSPPRPAISIGKKSLHISRPLTSAAMGASTEAISKLQQYTACDVSDALLKLKVPGSGFVADLNLYSQPKDRPTAVTVAPVSTVLFAAKGQQLSEPPANIPKGVHWADLTQPGTIVVLKQPEGQKNAICGGIMAVRMKVCDAKGIVVAGRARDIEELKGTALPVSSLTALFHPP